MKKILYNIVVVSMMLMAVSCDDFLDTSSPSDATADLVLQNATTARGALLKAYEQWRGNGSVHSNGLFYDLAVCGSDSERHPESYDGQARHIPENLYYGGTATFNIENTNGKSAWPNLYSIISVCNTICINFESGSMYQDLLDGKITAPTEMTDLYGQAVALRATAYYEMVRFFGDVPHQLSLGEKATGLTPRDQIYEYHLDKLMTVEPFMYRLGESSYDATFMSRTYVQGLISRICLYAGGYSTRRTDLGTDFYKDLEGNVITFDTKITDAKNQAIYARRTDYIKFYEIAKTYLQACVDNSGTASLPIVDPRSTGAKGQEFGNPFQYTFQQLMDFQIAQESVFEIPETPSLQGERPYAFGRPTSGASKENFPCKNYGQSRFHPTYYYGDFDPNDMRRDVTCTVTGTVGATGTETLLPFKPGSQAGGGGIANNKWDENRQQSPYWQASRKAGINNPYMRMADIILMLAEVKAELNDEIGAKVELAKVHNRAFKTVELANLDGFINKYGGIKEAIAQERKLEFGGEGLRRYDLIRTGKFPEAIKEVRNALSAMVAGLQANGYYTFENGNQISNYVWIKNVDYKSLKGYRLTTQTPSGMENDPVLYPGWRGVFDDWNGYTGRVVYVDDKGPTNTAIRGLFRYIDPNGAEAAELEADGYVKTAWGATILEYKDEYSTYVFRGYVEGEAPIYFVPVHSAAIKSSDGAITNGYGFPNSI